MIRKLAVAAASIAASFFASSCESNRHMHKSQSSPSIAQSRQSALPHVAARISAAQAAEDRMIAMRKDEGWIDAKADMATLGSVSVGVDYVYIGKVPVATIDDERRWWTNNEYLAVRLILENKSTTKKVPYRNSKLIGSPDQLFLAGLLVRDSNGNDLGEGLSGSAVPEGRAFDANIYPDRAITDQLVFELPVSFASGLELTFTLHHQGKSGLVRFFIPPGMIERRL